MQIIIVGQNRIEYCKIKPKDQEKPLFGYRRQLYIVPTDQYVRMRVVEYGVEKESEEVMIFPENFDTPYDVLHNSRIFTPDDSFPFIDEVRQPKRFWGGSQFARKARKAMNDFMAYGGILIACIVVAYAFINQVI